MMRILAKSASSWNQDLPWQTTRAFQMPQCSLSAGEPFSGQRGRSRPTRRLRSLTRVRFPSYQRPKRVKPTNSLLDYNHPLSKRKEALAPYFFTCGCPRCRQDLINYQVCAQSPVVDVNRQGLVSDLLKLREHPAGVDWDKASLGREHSEKLVDLVDTKGTSGPLEERRAVLQTWYQKCQGLISEDMWALSPLPQLLTEISILYAEEGNFVYALATACHIATACDPYRHVAPFHPVRIKGLFLVAKLLANTAADTAASLGDSAVVATRGGLNQRALQTLQDIDQVSLCQMLLIMVTKSIPAEHVQEWELSISAKQMLDDIKQLPGRGQEQSLISLWEEDPEHDQARAFFRYAVLMQVDALSRLGLEMLKSDFGQRF